MVFFVFSPLFRNYLYFGLKFLLPFSPQSWSTILEVGKWNGNFVISGLTLLRLASITFYLIQTDRRCTVNVFEAIYHPGSESRREEFG